MLHMSEVAAAEAVGLDATALSSTLAKGYKRSVFRTRSTSRTRGFEIERDRTEKP